MTYTYGSYGDFFWIRKKSKYGMSKEPEFAWRQPDWHATKREATPVARGTMRSAKLYVTCHRPLEKRYHTSYIIKFISDYETILIPRKYRKAGKGMTYTLSYHLGCDMMTDEPYWREAYEG